MRSPESKLRTLKQVIAWRDELREKGLVVVVTNGCFDLLHRGHVEYLARAREHGDALLVAVNSDASVRAVKGPGRPVVPEHDRAYMLASLESTDSVVIFTTPKPLDLLRIVVPDVYVKGGDYTEDTIDREEYTLLKSLGCSFRFVTHVEGTSTTDTIRKLLGPMEE